jgi:hypothetical protein
VSGLRASTGGRHQVLPRVRREDAARRLDSAPGARVKFSRKCARKRKEGRFVRTNRPSAVYYANEFRRGRVSRSVECYAESG